MILFLFKPQTNKKPKQIVWTYQKSFHSVQSGERRRLLTTQNPAGRLDHLLTTKNKTSSELKGRGASGAGATRWTNAYSCQSVGEPVQVPLPSWTQSIGPVLTAAVWQQPPDEEEPQGQALRRHPEEKKGFWNHRWGELFCPLRLTAGSSSAFFRRFHGGLLVRPEPGWAPFIYTSCCSASERHLRGRRSQSGIKHHLQGPFNRLLSRNHQSFQPLPVWFSHISSATDQAGFILHFLSNICCKTLWAAVLNVLYNKNY